jgi:hypothetical protein
MADELTDLLSGRFFNEKRQEARQSQCWLRELIGHLAIRVEEMLNVGDELLWHSQLAELSRLEHLARMVLRSAVYTGCNLG